MLSRSELEAVARTVSNGNGGHAQTLYLQDLVLRTISLETVDELVCTGGTALLKCYQLDRFSAALDFTARDAVDVDALVEAIARDLEHYGMPVARRNVERFERSITARLGVEGPLYTDDERSLCFIRIQVNTHSTVEDQAIERYTPRFRDVPTFDVVVLTERGIIAEKLRALLTRRQPRDLYDIYHLLDRSVAIDPALVQRKLEYYDIEYDTERIVDRGRTFEDQWASLEPLVYSRLPSFDTVMTALEGAVDRADRLEG